MNKLTKAAIAGGVGIALLLGGAGTLATWNSSSTVTGGTIVAGNLAVSAPTSSGWSVQHQSNGTLGTATVLTAAQFAAFKAVPGDKLTFTAVVPITASGNNLSATTALAGGAISAASSASADLALASALTSSAVTTISIPATTGVSGTAPTYTFAPGTGTINASATVTATITFPISTTAGAENGYMLGSVALSNMAVSIVQTY